MSIIGALFLGLVVILALSYFKISIREVVESPEGQDNINYVEETSKSVWEKYLAEPAYYLWHDIWLEIFWRPFVSNMKKLQNGELSDLEMSAPYFNY